MDGRNRDGGIDGDEHFLGDYACESTPYWTAFTVARSHDGFVFTAHGGMMRGKLVPSENSLTGTMFDRPLCLSRKEGSDRYTLSGEVQATKPGAGAVPVVVTLVKRVAPPSEAMERQFGVRAEALVRHVRHGERWIHEVRSLHLTAEITWTRTPEGIAHRKKELKAQFPEEDFKREMFWGLGPSEKDREEIHIDAGRFRHFRGGDRVESVQIWDGQTYTAHTKYLTHNQEDYVITPSLGNAGESLLDGFPWPRLAQRHRFWWMDNAPNGLDESDEFGRAEEFLLVGRQDYRGVPCYVLECHSRSGDVLRWFVGVEDSLLRGRLTYGAELKSEFWTDLYREVRPGWWFPMRQGYSTFDYDDGLRPSLSGWRENTVTQIEVDEDFPATLFQMEFKEGVRVVDLRFEGLVTYRFKKNMTEQDWERIRADARERGQEDSATRMRQDVWIGREAPAFPRECQWLNTAPLTWRDLRGKAVVLQFWSCDCGPCRGHIAQLRRPTDGSDTVLIGIHTAQNTTDEIREIMAKYESDGPVCVDPPVDRPGQGFGLLCSQLDVRVVPWWFVVGPDGKVVGHAMGPDRAFQMARDVLRGQPPSDSTSRLHSPG